MKRIIYFAAILVAAFCLCGSKPSSPVEVIPLKVEMQAVPIGSSGLFPRLSWQLGSKASGTMSSEDMSAVWQGDCTFIVLPDGSNKQFVLKHNPKFYADDFEVRNLCANGEVWTGRGQKSKKMYSGDPLLFDENMNSCGVLVTYGKFKYYNCGDLCGHNPPMRIFSKVKPTGHIIIRVYPGGKSWQVFVLDPYSSDYSVKYVSELKQL